MDTQILNERRRYIILRQLEAAPQFTATDGILIDVCRGQHVRTTNDEMDATLAWLERNGLIAVIAHPSLKEVRITQDGIDVARDEVAFPGVKRPEPMS